MSGQAPRHRGVKTEAQRRHELQFVFAVIAFLALCALAIWLAVRWDKVLLMVGLMVGSFVGTWWRDKRKTQKQARQN